MKKLKYLIPITLIITVLVTLFVVTNVYAETTEGYFTYTVSDGEATITDVDTSISGDVTIPSTLGGYPVTSLGDSAFSDCAAITNITIPDSIKSIGKRMFYGCTGITEITIPASVTDVGTQIFYKASNLHTVYYNSSYYSSDNPIFSVNNIKKIVFGGSYVPSNILQNNTTVEEVVIGDSVTSIGSYAFYGCSSLTSVTIGDSITSIDSCAFSSCSSLTSVNIPDSVTSIGYEAFYYCSSLTSIAIPDSVTSIGDYAFYGCSSLTSITVESGNTKYHSDGNCLIETDTKTLILGCANSIIPTDDSVTSIGDDAFYGCSSLTSVYITDIEAWCGIDFYDYASNPLSNGADLYLNNTLVTDLVIPDSVTSIGSYAFRGCSSLTSIVIPDSVTSIGSSAFCCCSSLTSIVIPDSVTSIADAAFLDCSNLMSVTIPDSVTSIGEYAFAGCSNLTSIVIPDSVTNISYGAFFGCSNLTSVTIPDSVTSIGGSAFYGCDALTTVYYGGNQSDWDKISIYDGNWCLTNANIIFATPDMPIYTISATPTDGGKVTGAGEYEQGTGVTLKATANEGYIFKGWYENGELVSADATITFIAEADRTLTAKFASVAVEIMYGDGQINMEDVILLRQYIANYNYETGSSTVILGPQQ